MTNLFKLGATRKDAYMHGPGASVTAGQHKVIYLQDPVRAIF